MGKILLTALAATVLVTGPATAQTGQSQEAWKVLRDANAEMFRRPAYVAPRGLPHPRVSSGAQLEAAFYDRSFWIEDFGTYRLPRPARNQQYIRYRNDVLLVNVRSGQVIRVLPDFFL